MCCCGVWSDFEVGQGGGGGYRIPTVLQMVVQMYTDQTCFLLHCTASRQGSNHDLVLYGNCDFKNITTVSFENVCLISSARDAVME